MIYLVMQTIFFDELHATESRKMVERLVNYVIYKGTFLPLVVPPTLVRAGLWSTWLTILCYLKVLLLLPHMVLEYRYEENLEICFMGFTFNILCRCFKL